MAGITDLAFRTLAREYGCSLCFTEMVSANGLVLGDGKSFEYLKSSPEDRPIGVQIFGSDPDILSEAARIVAAAGADLVDINMGCPVKKVLKTGAGAGLMRNPPKAADIFKAIRKAINLPLTVKIRSGWKPDEINAVDIAVAAEECGLDGLIVHPRTVNQGFGGSADWKLIALIKKRLRIPVIGSGDVKIPEDAVRMIDETGCDGIMVGRGSLGAPWIFGRIISRLSGVDAFPPPDLRERGDVIQRHMKMSIDLYGKKAGLRKFRKHLLWYTKGLRGGAKFRQSVILSDDPGHLLDSIHAYFRLVEESESREISNSRCC
jgi:nifR3 family TIM-barrel protein